MGWSCASSRHGRRVGGGPALGPQTAICVALAALCFGLGVPGGVSASDSDESSFSHRLAQAQYFLEEGLFSEAEQSLARAAADPQAPENPQVFVLLARCRLQLGRVGPAVDDIRRAEALYKGKLPPEAQNLFNFLTTRFGKVLVVGASLESALRPEPVAPILDPEIKRLLRAALASLDGQEQEGTTSVHLPVGAYQLGGHVVEVRADGNTRMDLRPSVGRAAAGVYGEQVTGAAAARDLGDSRTSGPALALRLGAAAAGQQKSAAFGLRVLLALEAPLAQQRAVLRLGGGLEMSQLEQIQGVLGGVPAGWLPFVHLAGGAQIPLPAGMALSPFFAWNVGYGHPTESLLPVGYLAPFHYLVHGPDVELRWTLPSRTGAAKKARVWVDLGARFLLRESWPFGELGVQDSRPHLSVGGGLDFGIRVGR